MDKEFIREILSVEDGTNEKLIKDGDFIDFELEEILCSTTKKNMAKAFYIYKEMKCGGYTYFIELKCPVCGCSHVKPLSKTKTFEALDSVRSNAYNDDFYCEKCMSEKIMREKEERRAKEKALEERAKIQSKRYIEEVLNPQFSYKKDVSAIDKINEVMDFRRWDYDFQDEIKNEILKMDYKEFLNTPYWDGVRNYKLKRSKYCCELCGGKGVLNVHHKTYKNHGEEHITSVANRDLIVLCKSCHEKFHDKLDLESK